VEGSALAEPLSESVGRPVGSGDPVSVGVGVVGVTVGV
jgi:hypothetical protein